MSSPAQLVVNGLVGTGAGLTVLASVAALRPRSVYGRLHYPSIVSSLAGPLIGIAVLVADGPGLTTATALLAIVLLAVTGPVLGAAIGRLNAERDGRSDVRSLR
jgi:monovalent cation/proton antiporter MnhG/PhaG subunit